MWSLVPLGVAIASLTLSTAQSEEARPADAVPVEICLPQLVDTGGREASGVLQTQGADVEDGSGIVYSLDDDAWQHLEPETDSMRGRYSQLVSLGEGWVIHLPSLTSDGEPVLPELCDALASDWAVFPEGGTSGLVFAGPRDRIVHQNGVTIIARDDGDHIVRALADVAGDAVDTLEALLGPMTAPQVSIALAEAPGLSTSRVGDVTRNGMMLIRLKSFEDADGLADQVDIRAFIAHEIAHYWNLGESCGSWKWISEGSADYVSMHLLNAERPGHLEHALTSSLNRCLHDLAREAHSILSQSDSYYRCGTILNWAVDLDLAARRDSAIFANDTRPDSYLSFLGWLVEHRQHVQLSADQVQTWFPEILGASYTTTETRSVIDLLEEYGAQIDYTPPGLSSQLGWFVHGVFRAYCPGSLHGVATMGSVPELHLGGQCADIPMDAGGITHIDEQPTTEFDLQAATKACTPGRLVTFAFGMPQDGSFEIDVPCHINSRPLRGRYEVVDPGAAATVAEFRRPSGAGISLDSGRAFSER